MASILTLPIRSKIEASRFSQVQLSASLQSLSIATQARKAYYEAVSAQQGSAYASQVARSAEAGAELASGMARAGHWSSMDLAREEAFKEDALAQEPMAAAKALSTREKLSKIMGLGPNDVKILSLPDRLPDLPESSTAIGDAQSWALSERLDVRSARLAMERTASSLGLAKATRFVNILDLGRARSAQGGGARPLSGYEISIEIPLFDWGQAKSRKAEAIYMQSASDFASAAIDAQSEAREAYGSYALSYERARRYRDRIVPLRKKLSEEKMLCYNGMLASVFELLADSREQAAAVNAAIDAQKDFWVAEAELRSALGGALPPLADAGKDAVAKEPSKALGPDEPHEPHAGAKETTPPTSSSPERLTPPASKALPETTVSQRARAHSMKGETQ